MNQDINKKLTITGLLMAMAILIPVFMPLKVVIPPASYTLASHVPIFLAIFLSRKITVGVVIGSTLGFLIAGFPIVIVMRAASHIIFAFIGACYIREYPEVLQNPWKFLVFNISCGLVHALGEVIACLIFYTTMSISNVNIMYAVFGLVGAGTIIHSIVDGYLSLYIYKLIPIKYLNLRK